MEDLDLKTLLSDIEGIARQAGAEILKHYNTTAVYTKKDGSPVTDADLASEKVILAALAKLTPAIPIVSEEQAAAGHVPDISGGTFWTVDPLDGTTEFKNKTDGFAVAIALIVDNKPVLGVLYHPSIDMLYSGRGPGTASKVNKGLRGGFTVLDQPPPEGMRVLVNESHADMPRIKGYLTAQFGRAAKVVSRPGTDAACIYQVADGQADMAVICSARRQGRKYWWDVAPGHAIAEAAGALVQTWEGQPLIYDAKDLQVPPYIVVSPQRTSSGVDQYPAPHDETRVKRP